MSHAYSLDEVFAIAEQIERNGARFYARAAELAQQPEVKAVLAQLAEWEAGHEQTFSTMRRRVAIAMNEGTWDPDQQAEAYLQAIAGDFIFKNKQHPADSITGEDSAATIFEIAIGLEKDAILFYGGLRAAMGDDTERAILDAIVAEEQSHVVYLSEKRAELLGAPGA